MMSEVRTALPSREIETGRAEPIVGFALVFVWLLLYAMGSLVGTEPARKHLASGAGVLESIYLVLLIALCYTPTNIAMLCCLASSIGGLFRYIKHPTQDRASPLKLAFFVCLPGFVIYLIIISGIVSFTGSSSLFISPSQAPYMRLAAIASLVSFTVGYSPGLLDRLLSRVERLIDPSSAAVEGTAKQPGLIDQRRRLLDDAIKAGAITKEQYKLQIAKLVALTDDSDQDAPKPRA